MKVVLEKKLTSSEKERHWVIVPAPARRKYFPPSDVQFRIKVKNKAEMTYIDAYNRLRLGAQVFDKLDLEEPGCFIVIKKDSEGTYVLRKRSG